MRVITLDYVTRHRVDVRGWRARDLIVAAGKRPVWSNMTKSWVINQDTAADVIAICDQRHITTNLIGDVPKVKWPEPKSQHDVSERAEDPAPGLWGESWDSASTRPAS